MTQLSATNPSQLLRSMVHVPIGGNLTCVHIRPSPLRRVEVGDLRAFVDVLEHVSCCRREPLSLPALIAAGQAAMTLLTRYKATSALQAVRNATKQDAEASANQAEWVSDAMVDAFFDVAADHAMREDGRRGLARASSSHTVPRVQAGSGSRRSARSRPSPRPAGVRPPSPQPLSAREVCRERSCCTPSSARAGLSVYRAPCAAAAGPGSARVHSASRCARSEAPRTIPPAKAIMASIVLGGDSRAHCRGMVQGGVTNSSSRSMLSSRQELPPPATDGLHSSARGCPAYRADASVETGLLLSRSGAAVRKFSQHAAHAPPCADFLRFAEAASSERGHWHRADCRPSSALFSREAAG